LWSGFQHTRARLDDVWKATKRKLIGVDIIRSISGTRLAMFFDHVSDC
jgi:hypothetical protein